MILEILLGRWGERANPVLVHNMSHNVKVLCVLVQKTDRATARHSQPGQSANRRHQWRNSMESERSRPERTSFSAKKTANYSALCAIVAIRLTLKCAQNWNIYYESGYVFMPS